MRITYRSETNKAYWSRRWADIPVDVPMENADSYPLKYAELTVRSREDRILEAGCGAGRILRHYHNKGYHITGFDFIEGVVEKLRVIDTSLRVEVGDIIHLRYSDESFTVVLAFGLYHNLEHGLEQAIAETYRVLRGGGRVCASFRADNLQTRLTDWLVERRGRPTSPYATKRLFHKMNLTRGECRAFFEHTGFLVQAIYPVENMPILYKLSCFREGGHKIFDENKARAEGYRLSWLGRILQNSLMRLLPNQFCNLYVVIAQKPFHAEYDIISNGSIKEISQTAF